MADVRIPPQSAIAAQFGGVKPLAKSEAVRAAQHAFFQAAMNQPQAMAAPARSAPTVSASPVARAQPLAPSGDAEPSRFARPGSLLDIKV